MSDVAEWIAILDRLELSFVVCDPAGEPRYVSGAAARILQLRERDNLSAHRDLLQPLAGFAAALRPDPPALGFDPPPERVEDLVIERLDGLRLHIVASGRVLGDAAQGARVVLFSDIALGDTLLRTLASFRRSRPTLVLTSVLAHKPVGDVSIDDLRDAARHLAEEFTPGGTRRRLQRLRCDLLPALTRAIDTVDPLLPEAFRILNEVSTSLLVLAPETTWIRLLVHLLIEAGDFGGLFGRAKIALRVPSTGHATRNALLGLLVERGPTDIVGGAPIHRYLARQLRPTVYNVSHRSTSHDEAPCTSMLEGEMVQALIGREGGAQLRESHRISDEEYSENLKVGETLADECGQALRAQLLANGMLLITLECPLVAELVSAAKEPATTHRGHSPKK